MNPSKVWRRIFGWREGEKASWLEEEWGRPNCVRRRYGTIYQLGYGGRVAHILPDPVREASPDGTYSEVQFMSLQEVAVWKLEEWSVGKRARDPEQRSKR